MLKIHVNDESLLDDLRDALAEASCSTVPVGPDTLLVTHALAVDEGEARLELSFFLSAWQASRPDAEVELLG
jgi:hypothetical protein